MAVEIAFHIDSGPIYERTWSLIGHLCSVFGLGTRPRSVSRFMWSHVLLRTEFYCDRRTVTAWHGVVERNLFSASLQSLTSLEYLFRGDSHILFETRLTHWL